MHRLFLRASNWTRHSENKRNNTKRSLRFEQMEGRQLMTVTLYGDMVARTDLQVLDPGPSAPAAVGSVNFDGATGTLWIEGSDVHADKVEIFINKRSLGGAGNIPDLLTVRIGNINTPLVRVFDPTLVKSIIVHTYGGDDTVDNRTSVPMDAYLGKGNDTGLGGAASDLLYGDDGDDWLDGRAGDDTLVGGNGSDKIFGDLGADALYGGNGNDFLFGGAGADRLKGEAGNDTLFGGSNNDTLSDTDGTNLIEQDYGHIPTRVPTISNFKSFWIFDHEFADPTVRSMVRLSYRDMEISRSDMLNIYNTIATDGVETSVQFNGSVSAHEYYDLKDMLSTSFPLKFAPSVKYLATQVVLGNFNHSQFEGAQLGTLGINSSGHKLNKLVDNWFKGGDLPTFTGNATYKAAQGSLFVNGASFQDIVQGQATDSGFLAQLGEVAMHSPTTISNMFIDNGDGTFAVKFFKADGAAAFVTVNRFLPVRNDGTALFAAFAPPAPQYVAYAFAGDGATMQGANELWVALAEKAYAQFIPNGSNTGSYDSLNGAEASYSFQHLTNKTSLLFHIKSTTTQSTLVDAMNAGKAITIHSKATVALGMTPSQDYMVVSNRFVGGVLKFELQNPQGFASPTKTLLLSWDEIKANFSTWTSVLL
jgi:Ca2+-binding RTX toxin-like protein